MCKFLMGTRELRHQVLCNNNTWMRHLKDKLLRKIIFRISRVRLYFYIPSIYLVPSTKTYFDSGTKHEDI